MCKSMPHFFKGENMYNFMEDFKANNIDDIVFGSIEAKERIFEIVEKRKAFPSFGKNGLLLYGIWGTGKTTLARMLPKAIELALSNEELQDEKFVQCKQGMNGADLMKSIDSQASLISLNASGKHYYILDEIDNLTNAAQASLKAAMNLPTSIFIMTTNHVEQVEKGVKNRSIMIDMNAASVEQWLPIIKALLKKANIKDADDQMLADLIEPCHGSVRDIMDAVTTIISRRNKMTV